MAEVDHLPNLEPRESLGQMVEEDHLLNLEPRESLGQMIELDHLPNLDQCARTRSNGGGGSPS